MKPRHVAEVRLARPVPGESTASDRALLLRLTERASADLPWETFRLDAGEGMVWDHHAVPMQGFRLPTAGPNAPLLKRVVRHPYEMEPEKPVRSQIFDTTRPDRTAVRAESVQMVFRASREARNLPAPTLLEHAPAPRPHPFARARAAGGDP